MPARPTTYIVRLYRCEGEGVAGVVEMPVQGREEAFRSFAELQAILKGASRTRGRRKEGERGKH